MGNNAELERKMQAVREQIGIEFSQLLADEAPVSSSFLANNISYHVEGDTVVFTMPRYALYVNAGTRPHALPRGALKQLADWAKRAGFTPQTEEEKKMSQEEFYWAAGWKVYWGIFQHGTPPNPFITRAIHKHLKRTVISAFKAQFR